MSVKSPEKRKTFRAKLSQVSGFIGIRIQELSQTKPVFNRFKQIFPGQAGKPETNIIYIDKSMLLLSQKV
jgi:hypothetical protein